MSLGLGGTRGASVAKLPDSPRFAGTVAAQNVTAAGTIEGDAVLIDGIAGQSSPMTLRGQVSGVGAPTLGTWTAGDLVFDQAGTPHFCNVGGTPGVWDNVTPAPGPVITGVLADTITPTTAILHGIVNPGGLATNFFFQYGTTTAYGTLLPLLPSLVGSDTNNDPVSVILTGLTAATTYHFQLIAVSAGGTTSSSDFTFATTPTPISVPTIAITGSSLIGQTVATISGTVVPNGATTTYFFEYGLTTGYGTQIPVSPGAAGSGFATFNASANITGLTANTLYHWRLQASNSAGSASPTADQTFTTTNVAVPTVTTGTAGTIANNSAILSGTINPNSSATTYHYEIGLTTAYSLPHVPVADASAGSGAAPVTPLSQTASGLAASTLYHFRLVATNPGGTIFGADQTFTTTGSGGTLIPAQFFRINYNPSGPLAQPRQSFARYQFVNLQRSGVAATDQARIAAIKAENPLCKVFYYQDPCDYHSGAGGYLTGAVDPVTITENWFLHDRVSGQRIPTAGYPGLYLLNLGEPTMQSAVVSNAQAVMAASGFDGVYFDVLTANISWLYPANTWDARFPMSGGNITPAGAAAWQAGVTYFCQHAVTTLRNVGIPCAGNLGGTWAFPSANLWSTWGQYLDVLHEEELGDNGQGLAGSSFYVPTELTNLAWSEANSKLTVCNTGNTTELGQAYGLAMMLLVANGHLCKGTQNKGAYTSESWYGASGIAGANEYDKAILLGAASGAYTGTKATGYMRLFAGGSASNVKLNATAGALTIGGVSVPAYTGQINYVP